MKVLKSFQFKAQVGNFKRLPSFSCPNLIDKTHIIIGKIHFRYDFSMTCFFRRSIYIFNDRNIQGNTDILIHIKTRVNLTAGQII